MSLPSGGVRGVEGVEVAAGLGVSGGEDVFEGEADTELDAEAVAADVPALSEAMTPVPVEASPQLEVMSTAAAQTAANDQRVTREVADIPAAGGRDSETGSTEPQQNQPQQCEHLQHAV